AAHELPGRERGGRDLGVHAELRLRLGAVRRRRHHEDHRSGELDQGPALPGPPRGRDLRDRHAPARHLRRDVVHGLPATRVQPVGIVQLPGHARARDRGRAAGVPRGLLRRRQWRRRTGARAGSWYAGATTSASTRDSMSTHLGPLDRLAYRSQHLGLLINATLVQEAARWMSRMPRPRLSGNEVRAVLRRRDELHARDLANVEAGLYPRDLLFDIPVGRYMRALPRLLRDTPRVIRRKPAGAFRDIPAVDKKRYPAYYRRTFHWQTDGYFSDHSAEVYELGVELLFRGTADVMRRQIIPPVTRAVRAAGGASRVRLLDVACGTGRTLHQLAIAHPTLRLYGVDLSPAYV